MHEIKKLDTNVVNQIAAGEVVERPASIVKELVENSIDAGATQIDVSIEGGGMTKIEVKDNGKGISEEDLPAAFERYATSKLSTVDDLSELMSYGFRGEALAAISAVSKATILTKHDDLASLITSDNGKLSKITPGSRSQGTTITIENLFGLIPARQKFLKGADTEYKYIVKIFTQFALLNGSIHFTLANEGKSIYNFPVSESKQLPVERVAKVYSVSSSDLLPISHEEYGIKVFGFILHPKLLGNTSKFFSSFINQRPIEDKGIFRSVQQGIADFVPDFFKPSAVISVEIAPDQVDVNVHPRKTEVKLLNPFRVYAAITHAIKNSLQQQISEPVRQIGRDSFSRQTTANSWDSKEENAYSRLRGGQQAFFYDGTETAIAEQNKLRQDGGYVYQQQESSENEPVLEARIPEYLVEQARTMISEAEVSTLLGRYLVVGFVDEVWIVDQHAAAERIRYEQFKQAYLEGKILSKQQVLVPIELNITEEEQLVLSKNSTVLTRLGFDVTISGSNLQVTAIPTFLQYENIEKLLRDTINEFVEHDDIFLSPIIDDFSSQKNLSLVIATMACHNSVRMKEKLSHTEAKSIIADLLRCKVPYACPHGRRIVWRLSKEEIDRQFMRN